MHELALGQSIVDMIVECAQREGIGAVTRVVVEVGAATAVEPEALRFCFDVVAEQTALKGAELVVDTIAVRARCRRCAGEYAPETWTAPCPHCGGFDPELLAGRELRVKSFSGA